MKQTPDGLVRFGSGCRYPASFGCDFAHLELRGLDSLAASHVFGAIFQNRVNPRRAKLMNYTVAAVPVATQAKDELLRLMRENFPWGHEADAWFRWGYEQSPFRPNSCWLVETEDRERVGFTALMPRRMKLGDQIRDVGQAANLNVSAEHRSANAAIKLQRALVSHLDQSDLELAFGITRNAVGVLRRAGYRDIGTFSRWIKYFRTEHRLKAKIPWSSPRWAISRLLDLSLRLRTAETFHGLPDKFQILVNPEFDERFDALWEIAAPNFAIATERTRDYLVWRFGNDPQSQYQTLAVQDAQGKLCGFLIYEFPEPDTVEPMCSIVDILPADVEALNALMTTLCRRLRHAGAVGITMKYFGSPMIENALRRFGFFRRISDYHLLAHLHPRLKECENDLLAPERWHVTDAEAKF